MAHGGMCGQDMRPQQYVPRIGRASFCAARVSTYRPVNVQTQISNNCD